MTIDEFEAVLADGHEYTRQGNTFSVDREDIDLGNLTTIPEGITLVSKWSINLRNLPKMPKGVTLKAEGDIDLARLVDMPEGTTVGARWDINLDNLMSIPDGVTLLGGGTISARSLTSWRGMQVLTAASITCLVTGNPKTIDGVEIIPVKIFNACEIDDMPRYYIARRGDIAIPGETIREAVKNLKFKILRSFNKDELAEQIKLRGRITKEEFCVLTGACRYGLDQGMQSLGLDPKIVNSVSVSEIVELVRGRHGEGIIHELFG